LQYIVAGDYQKKNEKKLKYDTLVAIKTRRPASADRTARAANFRRDLEAT